MDKNRLRNTRLSKEQISLEKDPLENAFVKRQGELKFYFCLYKLEDDFTNGFYFGLLELHQDYPFYAPKLFMYTPNGRYEQNLAICTSFTNYHQESWTSAWNVRTLIQATISFMYANEPSYGCRADPAEMRKKYARDSLSWNLDNDLFKQIFSETIKSKLAHIVNAGVHIYDKQMISELRKLGLEEMNNKNLGKILANPQINPIDSINRQEQQVEYLRRPLLIDRQIRQMGEELHEIELHNQQQKKRMLNEEKRIRREKHKKIIINIIGFFATVGTLGFLVYYSWYKPTSNVSASQTNPNTSQKPTGLLNFLYTIPKNLKEIISALKPTQNQKIMVNNS